MFVAHVPAWYLLTNRVEARWRTSGLMPVGVAASILPDLDLVTFCIVDHRRVLHHAYWTPRPVLVGGDHVRLVCRRRGGAAPDGWGRSAALFANDLLLEANT